MVLMCVSGSKIALTFGSRNTKHFKLNTAIIKYKEYLYHKDRGDTANQRYCGFEINWKNAIKPSNSIVHEGKNHAYTRGDDR